MNLTAFTKIMFFNQPTPILYYLYKMIRLNQDTPAEVLNEIKKGDLVTDTFSKTGLVEEIDISDDGLYKIYAYTLVTGRVITVKI